MIFDLAYGKTFSIKEMPSIFWHIDARYCVGRYMDSIKLTQKSQEALLGARSDAAARMAAVAPLPEAD